MEFSNLFPNWYERTASPDLPWDIEIDLSESDSFYDVLGFLAFDQNATLRLAPDSLGELSEAIVQDILNLQAETPVGCNLTNLLYLQFEATLSPIGYMCNKGNYGSFHDWILNGFSDEIGHAVERQFHTRRSQEFAQSDIAWIVVNRAGTVTDWAYYFYYYCRRRAALFEVAQAILPTVLSVMEELPLLDDRSIKTRCMIANWASEYNLPIADILVMSLVQIFNMPALSTEIRTHIAVFLSTKCGERSDRTPQAWAELALQIGREILQPQEILQLRCNLIFTHDDWNIHGPSIIDAAQNYAANFRHLDSHIAIAKAVDSRATLVNPIFFVLHRLGLADDFLTFLQNWYDVPQDTRLLGGVLFVSANHNGKTAFLGTGTQLISPVDDTLFFALMQTTNQALGLTITVQGEADVVPAPERPGQPDYQQGRRFETELRQMYCFDQVNDENIGEASAMAIFPGNPHPIQALLSAARNGTTLPITTSLQQPMEDRPLNRALLWDTQGDYYSTFEIDAVHALLTSVGIECERCNGGGCSVDQFLTTYENPNHDLVWIAGHGELNHWDDGSFQLNIGNDLFVGIDEMVARIPDEIRRRLLMLNICDGGGSATNGGIHRLGLAAMLAKQNQATISHHWPVRPPVAGAFGTILAGYLVQNLGFFASFEATLSVLRAPLVDVTRAVNALVPDLDMVQRIENSGDDTENILNWGSPCFYQ